MSRRPQLLVQRARAALELRRRKLNLCLLNNFSPSAVTIRALVHEIGALLACDCEPEHDYERFLVDADKMLEATAALTTAVPGLPPHQPITVPVAASVEVQHQQGSSAPPSLQPASPSVVLPQPMPFTSLPLYDAPTILVKPPAPPQKSPMKSRAGHLGVPIAPRVSLTFADAVAAGQVLSTHPMRAAFTPVAPDPRLDRSAGVTQQTRGTIVWVRVNDMRLHDNPALVHAAERQAPVHLVFVWADAEDADDGRWRLGGTAAALWIHHALSSLDAALKQKYSGFAGITFRTATSAAACLKQMAGECGADVVVTSRSFDPAGTRTERAVSLALGEVGVKLVALNSFLLHDVEEIRVDMTEWRGHFGTLTPFLTACHMRTVPHPLPPPSAFRLPRAQVALQGCSLDKLGLARMPIRGDGSVKDWASPILSSWQISESAALETLRSFLAKGGGMGRYETERHLADASGVSRLSPYLRFGMLSCRTLYWDCIAAGAKQSAAHFYRRLIWRDLAYWQLQLFPQMRDAPIRSHYSGQAWSTDTVALDRWRCASLTTRYRKLLLTTHSSYLLPKAPTCSYSSYLLPIAPTCYLQLLLATYQVWEDGLPSRGRWDA